MHSATARLSETGTPFIHNPTSRPIRIGFVPMSDCAPLIIAKELGFFERAGVNVRLSREVGWASVRERMLHNELEGAHAHASMVFELCFALPRRSIHCKTGVVISHNGSALSLSNELWELGVRDARSLGKLIQGLRGRRRLRFAAVQRFSTQNYLLRQWLRNGGIDPDKDVEVVIVPPPQVSACMMSGHVDGYCAGEPWSSVGLLDGNGWCAALSCDIAPMHPEKVLLVQEAFANDRRAEHTALIGAIIQAAIYCDKPVNREAIAEILAAPNYFNVSKSALLNSLRGPFQHGKGIQSSALNALVFHRDNANAPTEDKARWILDQIHLNRLLPDRPKLTSKQIGYYFDMDLYNEALNQLEAA